MRTLNRVYLIGAVGRDPEVKLSASNTAFASLSLATNERLKDKQGNWQDKAEWHALTAFGRTAEIVRDYVKKGSAIHVEGRIQTRSWEKDGQTHYRTEIVVENLILLGSNKEKSRVEANPSVAHENDDIPF